MQAVTIAKMQAPS